MMSHSVANRRIESLRVASVANVAYADADAYADANNGVRKSKTTPTPSISKEGGRLSNHLAAPVTAAFAASMRQTFGSMPTIWVRENDIALGKVTEVTDIAPVAYSKSRTVKGKTVYSRTEFTVARIA